MDNFTAIRNGLREHIRAGRLCPFDLGVYIFLHLSATWTTGIYDGSALGIAHGFNDPALKEHIQKSLRRLRDRRFINYLKGGGKRGNYPILINKYEVTAGEQSGRRLDAWKHGDLCRPYYECQNGTATVETGVMAPTQDHKTSPKRQDTKIDSFRENQSSEYLTCVTQCASNGSVIPQSLPTTKDGGRGPDALAQGLVQTWAEESGGKPVPGALGLERDLVEVLKKESARWGKTMLEVADEMRAKIPLYLKSQKAKSEFAWSAKTWFLDGHYRDDPASWNGGTSPTGRNVDAEILEASRQRAIEREEELRERRRRQAAGQ